MPTDWNGEVRFVTESGTKYHLDIPDAKGFRDIFRNDVPCGRGKVAGTGFHGFYTYVEPQMPEVGDKIAIKMIEKPGFVWISTPIKAFI